MKYEVSTTRRRSLLRKSWVLLAVPVLAAFTAWAGGSGPDVTVHELTGVWNWGGSGGFRGYSVGTTSCNIGDQPLWWCNDFGDTFCEVNQHPVIAQNMYRLKEGRFEQIGMSWLKHGFASLNTSSASCGNGNCIDPPHGGDQLGVGCTDPYGSHLNGDWHLGLRSEVNATTGDFPYPFTEAGSTSAAPDQRIKVAEVDLDPALNPGARYWVEGHYVAADDAAAGHGLNNASYREVTVSMPNYQVGLTGSTIRKQPAIYAWSAADPAVEIALVTVSGNPDQLFHAARKVTPLKEGGYHYEYAIHNMNSDRGARRFTVQFSGAETFDNVGFRDVDHHSGEPYATADWAQSVNEGTGEISWSTSTFAADPLANALRWGTMFTFWFDSSGAPRNAAQTLELFKPGLVTSVPIVHEGYFFADGFESGNTSAWDAAVP